MRVVSIMNYKGGVGKTTITANLGAGLAQLGRKVLMLDLDPQTNLTLSFYSMTDWLDNLEKSLTIKRWFDAHVTDGAAPPKLSELVVTPPSVASVLEQAGSGGQVDLIPSHLELFDLDLDLARELLDGDPGGARARRVRLYRILADALEDDDLANYDYVLIDCAPDFGLVTQTAVVASDLLLVPTKADRLSTLSMGYFTRSVERLVKVYNGLSPMIPPIRPQFLGAVLTMVQVWGGQPIATQQQVIDEIASISRMSFFDSWIRNLPREAIESVQEGVPTILRGRGDGHVVAEYKGLRDEFVKRIEG